MPFPKDKKCDRTPAGILTSFDQHVKPKCDQTGIIWLDTNAAFLGKIDYNAFYARAGFTRTTRSFTDAPAYFAMNWHFARNR